ncbi:PREDICTED: pheromone-binding protein Gp-9-like [Wasmannia auropunctata]|uniref:pheromone-binding protein Gp-9-like n=1 Tax=Wasmannia auropunctata TaxID=64793 RepID=UPI0005F05B11|nr:PREDICTED: pheromone-binding protein Gp-9-like [Wasmannia auropunctata]
MGHSVYKYFIFKFQSSSSTELTIKEQLKNGAQPIEEDFDTCLTENDLTRDDFYKEEDIMTNVHTKSENEEKTRKIGCWIACVLKKQNLVSSF